MANVRYEPQAYSLGVQLTEGLTDNVFQEMHRVMVENARIVMLRTDVQMGMGLSHEDALFLFSAYDEANAAALAKPPPSLFTSVRHWLARKLDGGFHDMSDY